MATPSFVGSAVETATPADYTRLLLADATLYDPNGIVDSSSESSTESLVTITSGAAYVLGAGFSGAQYYVQIPGVSWHQLPWMDLLLHVITSPGAESDIEVGLVYADNAGDTALRWVGGSLRYDTGYAVGRALCGGYSATDLSADLASAPDRLRTSMVAARSATTGRPYLAGVTGAAYEISASKPQTRKAQAVVRPIVQDQLVEGNPIYAVLTLGSVAALTAQTVGVRAWYRCVVPTTGHDE